MMYQLVHISDLTVIVHQDLGAIPTDELNRHYLEYVAWLFEGNTPEEITIDPTQPESEN